MKKRKAKRRKPSVYAAKVATLTIGRQRLTGLITAIDCTAEQITTGPNAYGRYDVFPTGRYRVILTLLGGSKP